jgi:hypothetical protein
MWSTTSRITKSLSDTDSMFALAAGASRDARKISVTPNGSTPKIKTKNNHISISDYPIFGYLGVGVRKFFPGFKNPNPGLILLYFPFLA